MKDHAETVIVSYPLRGDPWMVHGRDRAEAEVNCCDAIVAEIAAPPAYRVIVQAKVDQHDWEYLPSYANH